jgi:hypothetical protein
MHYTETLLLDAKEFVNDWGIPMTCATSEVFRVMVSDPSVQQTLDAGGFVNQTSFNLKVVATPTAWTTADGDVGGSTGSLSGGVAISPLAIGKKVTAANLGLRIVASQYKPGSAWVILTVHTDTQ